MLANCGRHVVLRNTYSDLIRIQDLDILTGHPGLGEYATTFEEIGTPELSFVVVCRIDVALCVAFDISGPIWLFPVKIDGVGLISGDSALQLFPYDGPKRLTPGTGKSSEIGDRFSVERSEVDLELSHQIPHGLLDRPVILIFWLRGKHSAELGYVGGTFSDILQGHF